MSNTDGLIKQIFGKTSVKTKKDLSKNIKLLEYHLEKKIIYSFRNYFDKIYIINRDFHSEYLNLENIFFNQDLELYRVLYENYRKTHGHYDYEDFSKILIMKNIIMNAKKNNYAEICIFIDRDMTTTVNFEYAEKHFNEEMTTKLEWDLLFINRGVSYLFEGDQGTINMDNHISKKVELCRKNFVVCIKSCKYDKVLAMLSKFLFMELYRPVQCLGLYFTDATYSINLQ